MPTACPCPGRRTRRSNHRHQQLGIDLSGAEVGVPVAARARRILGVVAVHQVDPAGDAFDAVDGVDQRLARRPGVAGVQAKANPFVADLVPEPSDGVEVAGHGMIAARGVLQVDGNFGLQLVERLAPALEALVEVAVLGDVAAMHNHRRRADVGRRVAGVLQDLARRDPHPVVRRRNVDQIGRVHVDRQRRGFERCGVVARLGRLPALRVAEENLDHIGVFGRGCGQRILRTDM
jgi:hypothetical protein